MKVVLAGATGMLGVPITEQLLAAGHEVVGITRTTAGVQRLHRLGATALVADVMDRAALLAAAGGVQADAVMHQLTALKKAPAGHQGMAATNALRIAGTTHLLDLARAVGARRFVTQSIVFGYGYSDHGSELLTEQSPFGQTHGNGFDEHIQAMASAEQQVFAADGIEGVALRYGLLYGAAADQAKVARMLRRRALPAARHGGELAFVHHDDAAAATVAALERGEGGQAYNVVDDTPATFRALLTATARATNAPKPLVLPGWLLRLVAPYGVAILSDVSLRVANAKAKRELGWAPRYPSIAAGVHG
jgi:nucleoside-diphosphate-sugar epimerase